MRMDLFQETFGEKLIQGVIASLVMLFLLFLTKSILLRLIHFLRFSYIAVCCLSLLHQLDKIDVEKAVNYIVKCKNLDGGFGCTPGGESHAGQSMLVTWCTLIHFGIG